MIQHLLALVLLITGISSTKMTIAIERYEKQCFYEKLQSMQKYSIDVSSRSLGGFELQVSYKLEGNGNWEQVYYKKGHEYQTFKVHKLATVSTTHGVCLRSNHNETIKLNINFQSGLQLMEFDILPDKSDSENLERELGFLENQKEKLFEGLDRMQGLRQSTKGLTNIMSTKMIGFAIVGLLSIIVVNAIFYRELKKTLKDRKLI